LLVGADVGLDEALEGNVSCRQAREGRRGSTQA
jgi:hypothetical protein